MKDRRCRCGFNEISSQKGLLFIVCQSFLPWKQQLRWTMRVLTAEAGLLFLAADHSWQKIVWRWTNSSTENVLRNPREFIPAGPAGNQTAVYLTSFPNPPSPSFSRSPSATELPVSLSWDQSQMRHLAFAPRVQMNQIRFSPFLRKRSFCLVIY